MTDLTVKNIFFTDELVKWQITDSISENLTDSDLESKFFLLSKPKVSKSVFIFSTYSKISKTKFYLFRVKIALTGTNCSHELVTFLKYHMPSIKKLKLHENIDLNYRWYFKLFRINLTCEERPRQILSWRAESYFIPYSIFKIKK